MKKLLRALKQWTLLIAIVVGAVGHSFFSQFTWLAPWLLASMLLLTFCNISPRDLRFHPLHLILMSLQIVMSLGLYALTLPWHPAIAQGVCMAALTPTATAAAIITGMLGGSVAFLAAYAFLSNLAIVVLALIATGQIDTPFLETMSNVFMRVGPTMLFPLLAAWLIQYAAPKVNAVLLRWGILAYYLWAGMLVILMGGTFEQLLKPGEKDYQLEIFLALTGIAVCTANFILGKSIGSRFHRRIAGGQALAQKNIILPMWPSHPCRWPPTPSSRTSSTPPRYGSKDAATTASSSASTTSTRKSTPAYRPPSSLSLRKNTPNFSRSCLPASRTGSRSNRAPRAQTERASEHPGKSQAPIRGWPLSRMPSHGATGPREARSLQRKSPSKKALPPQRVPCTGSALLFSARHAAPNRPPVASFTSLLRIPNKTPAARKRQALSSPRRRGTFPLRPLPKGNV